MEGESLMSEAIEEIDFEYMAISDLPDYWKMIVKGGTWQIARAKTSTCPYDGGNLISMVKPIEHYHCMKCGRNYA